MKSSRLKAQTGAGCCADCSENAGLRRMRQAADILRKGTAQGERSGCCRMGSGGLGRRERLPAREIQSPFLRLRGIWEARFAKSIKSLSRGADTFEAAAAYAGADGFLIELLRDSTDASIGGVNGRRTGAFAGAGRAVGDRSGSFDAAGFLRKPGAPSGQGAFRQYVLRGNGSL